MAKSDQKPWGHWRRFPCLAQKTEDLIISSKGHVMNIIAIKDLKQPRRLKERLSTEKELLLTSDGKPVAVLVNVGAGEDPDLVIQALRDSRSRLALARARESARKAGTSGMSMRDIEKEIATARKERRISR